MFAVVDCGTTNTRVFIVDESDHRIVASGGRKVGVRDTSITGSRDALRNGVTELFFSVLAENGIPSEQVSFAIASGMITSEIGLIDIPHMVAPAGLRELSDGIVKVEDPAVLPIGRPIYFVRGIRNNYPADAGVPDLLIIDFMRGEEVQCMGVLEQHPDMTIPCSIVALSSHTKVMYIDDKRRIAASNTTISGQFYEALIGSTNIGKSIVHVDGEEAGGYSFETLVETATECINKVGLGRTMLMPRFMQVLLKTNSEERNLFVNAAIAADDIKAIADMRERGLASDHYVFYGKKSRCDLYQYMMARAFGDSVKVECIWDKEAVSMLTVRGAIAVAGDLPAMRKG